MIIDTTNDMILDVYADQVPDGLVFVVGYEEPPKVSFQIGREIKTKDWRMLAPTCEANSTMPKARLFALNAALSETLGDEGARVVIEGHSRVWGGRNPVPGLRPRWTPMVLCVDLFCLELKQNWCAVVHQSHVVTRRNGDTRLVTKNKLTLRLGNYNPKGFVDLGKIEFNYGGLSDPSRGRSRFERINDQP